MIDKVRLNIAWNNHIENYDHGESYGCDPQSCLGMIVNEYDKLLWASNPHNVFNPNHDPGMCRM